MSHSARLLTFLMSAALASLPGRAAEPAAGAPHHTYVLIHGATGGGWDWRTMERLLTADGHTVFRPTLTGLGEKVHLTSPNISLTTHVSDIVNVILFENLHDVVLVGHSYGGMVITGVMDRIPERLSHVVFLDAMVPDDGQSVVTLGGHLSPDDKVVDGLIHFSWLKASKPIPGDVPQSYKTYSESYANPASRTRSTPACTVKRCAGVGATVHCPATRYLHSAG